MSRFLPFKPKMHFGCVTRFYKTMCFVRLHICCCCCCTNWICVIQNTQFSSICFWRLKWHFTISAKWNFVYLIYIHSHTTLIRRANFLRTDFGGHPFSIVNVGISLIPLKFNQFRAFFVIRVCDVFVCLKWLKIHGRPSTWNGISSSFYDSCLFLCVCVRV